MPGNLLMNVTNDMRFTANRWLFTGICLLALIGKAWAQEDVKISSKTFRTGIEMGYKEARESVKQGDRNFRAGLGTYQMARDHYLFAHQYNPNHAGLNYKLGVCYLFADNKYEAIDYLQRAYTIDNEVSGDIHLLLGMAYQHILEFDKAMEHFTIFSKVQTGENSLPESYPALSFLNRCVLVSGCAFRSGPIYVSCDLAH